MSWPRAASLALASVVAVWAYGVLFPTAEDRIRRRLGTLAETASVAPGETNLERMARAARIGRFVTDGVVIDLGGRFRTATGREAVVGGAACAPIGADGVEVEFLDERIVVSADGNSASVNVTARGTGVDLVSGDEQIDALELDMTWQVVDDVWLVDEVAAVETIRRP